MKLTQDDRWKIHRQMQHLSNMITTLGHALTCDDKASAAIHLQAVMNSHDTTGRDLRRLHKRMVEGAGDE